MEKLKTWIALVIIAMAYATASNAQTTLAEQKQWVDRIGGDMIIMSPRYLGDAPGDRIEKIQASYLKAVSSCAADDCRSKAFETAKAGLKKAAVEFELPYDYVVAEYTAETKSAPQQPPAPVVKHSTNPFKLQVGDDPIFPGRFFYLYITSLENDMAVQDVVVNRGNCNIKASGSPTAFKARYGGTMKYRFTMSSCRILEVNIRSNYGDWTYTFN